MVYIEFIIKLIPKYTYVAQIFTYIERCNIQPRILKSNKSIISNSSSSNNILVTTKHKGI